RPRGGQEDHQSRHRAGGIRLFGGSPHRAAIIGGYGGGYSRLPRKPQAPFPRARRPLTAPAAFHDETDSMADNRQQSTAPGTMAQLVADLRQRQEKAREMGGPEGLARHRASGRLPVRERIALMIDEGSWFEIGALGQPEYRREKYIPGDAVVTGFARVDGRRVGVIGIDSSV